MEVARREGVVQKYSANVRLVIFVVLHRQVCVMRNERNATDNRFYSTLFNAPDMFTKLVNASLAAADMLQRTALNTNSPRTTVCYFCTCVVNFIAVIGSVVTV